MPVHESLIDREKEGGLLIYPANSQIDLSKLSNDGSFTLTINIRISDSHGLAMVDRQVNFNPPPDAPDWLSINPVSDTTDHNGSVIMIIAGSLLIGQATTESFIYTVTVSHSVLQDAGIITIVECSEHSQINTLFCPYSANK